MTRCTVCHQPLTLRRPGELLHLDAKRREVWCHLGRCMARYNDEPLEMCGGADPVGNHEAGECKRAGVRANASPALTSTHVGGERG